MESYDGGEDEFRGRNGPLRVTDTPRNKIPLVERIIQAAENIGLPYNPDQNGRTQEGISMSQTTIAKGRRQSTAFCYLDPARRRKNLTIEQGAMGESLIIEGKRCVGVRYSVHGEKREARATREVIVSGGSINSPKLLELSGIGQSDFLREKGITPVHELPGVGENLRDHYSPRVRFEITEKGATFNDNGRGWRLGREAIKYALTGQGLFAMTAAPIRMYFKTREGLESPDAAIAITPFLYELDKDGHLKIAKQRGVTLNINVLRSESIGSIHVKSTDPFQPPAINFNFMSSEYDRQGTVAAIRKARELFAASPLADVVGQELAPGAHVQSDEDLVQWICDYAETTYHPVGTCKMGADPMAVVDDQLRVHGIERLRIADASIMPTLTSGNTNAPSIMIGEKCAEMVLAAASEGAQAAA